LDEFQSGYLCSGKDYIQGLYGKGQQITYLVY